MALHSKSDREIRGQWEDGCVSSTCRFCKCELRHTMIDLGLSPVSNHFREASTIGLEGQTYYPLKAMVCSNCWLVQLTDVQTPPHFTADYVYFSSHSKSWLDHARRYADQIRERVVLTPSSLVVELASNDGYLLQYFKRAGISVLGIDPTANTAEFARREHGIETIVDFFGESLASQLQTQGIGADLVVGNNVLAHVPDPNDFIAGIARILKPLGTVTLEFPHLLKMLSLCQFDTIYHEHFSYLSLLAVERMLGVHGLAVYGVEELPTHGGSLRVYAAHEGSAIGDEALAAERDKVRQDEADAELSDIRTYSELGSEAARRKMDLLDFLISAKREGKRVLGYGAPAKGNTLLNYCGIGPELLEYTVDVSPLKQGRYLPGVNVPVRSPDVLLADRPDYILILPWNLREEIAKQLSVARDWGGRFVVAIPKIEIF